MIYDMTTIKRTKTIMKKRKSSLLLTLLLCSSAATADKAKMKDILEMAQKIANETKDGNYENVEDDDAFFDDDEAFFDDDDVSDDDDILSVVDNAPPGQLLDVLLSKLAEKNADEFDDEQISLMDDMIKQMDGILEEAFDKARARGDKVEINEDGNIKLELSEDTFRNINVDEKMSNLEKISKVSEASTIREFDVSTSIKERKYKALCDDIMADEEGWMKFLDDPESITVVYDVINVCQSYADIVSDKYQDEKKTTKILKMIGKLLDMFQRLGDELGRFNDVAFANVQHAFYHRCWQVGVVIDKSYPQMLKTLVAFEIKAGASDDYDGYKKIWEGYRTELMERGVETSRNIEEVEDEVIEFYFKTMLPLEDILARYFESTRSTDPRMKQKITNVVKKLTRKQDLMMRNVFMTLETDLLEMQRIVKDPDDLASILDSFDPEVMDSLVEMNIKDQAMYMKRLMFSGNEVDLNDVLSQSIGKVDDRKQQEISDFLDDSTDSEKYWLKKAFGGMNEDDIKEFGRIMSDPDELAKVLDMMNMGVMEGVGELSLDDQIKWQRGDKAVRKKVNEKQKQKEKKDGTAQHTQKKKKKKKDLKKKVTEHMNEL